MKMAKSNKLSQRLEKRKNSKGVLASEKNQINSDRKNYFVGEDTWNLPKKRVNTNKRVHAKM